MAIAQALLNPTKKLMNFLLTITNFHSTLSVNINAKAGVLLSQDARGRSASSFAMCEDVKSLCKQGRLKEALDMLPFLDCCGIIPDSYTYASLLQACLRMKSLPETKLVHAHIILIGFNPDPFLETKLLNTYANCRNLADAHRVLEGMPERDVVSWTAMIAAYAQDGDGKEALKVFKQMQRAGCEPDHFTFASVLPAFAELGILRLGREVHEDFIRRGFKSNVFVDSALVDMYDKCGSLEDARKVFDRIRKRDVFLWNVMIRGYAKKGFYEKAITMYDQMQEAGIKPDNFTFSFVLMACANLLALEEGKRIHDDIIRADSEFDVYVGNALLNMYCKCGCLEDARQVFNKMSERDVVSWNAMIVGHAQNGCAGEALRFLSKMRTDNIMPNSVTMVSVLPACAQLAALQQGKCLHAYIIRIGFDLDVVMATALIDMYAKCGSVEIVCCLFKKMGRRDLVSWNAMIAGHVQNGCSGNALTLFKQMQQTGTRPDTFTIVSVLTACAYLGVLQQGKWIHGYAIRRGFDLNVFVGTALTDMYAKCGGLEFASEVFDRMHERDLFAWNAVIAAYGRHGHGQNALALFSRMLEAGLRPNHITFTHLLSACSHAGLIDEGWHYYNLMDQDYCITPRLEHYACIVDLLGRAGHLDEAVDFIKKMPLEPDTVVWGALLAACRIHCNIELGQHVAEHLFELEPQNAGWHVLLSNIYAAAGRWDDVAKVRTVMKDGQLKKTPGCSLIELDNTVHLFYVGDGSHPQSENIYAMLDTLYGLMKEAGYVPRTDFVLHDVEEEVKEQMLSSHSEKLAIAFGILSTSPGIPVQIMKNLRVCADCHNATKFISKIVRRDLVVRDANRFHHFRNGLCSCGDYW